MSDVRASPAEAAVMAEAFARTFSHWGITLPDGAVERAQPGTMRHAGWTIRYVFDADEGGSYLEYYAVHRMTSDTRRRIYGSGEIVELDAIWEAYAWDAKEPGDEERARRAYREHNARVAEELKRLGLFPEGDINTYLRTEDAPGPET